MSNWIEINLPYNIDSLNYDWQVEDELTKQLFDKFIPKINKQFNINYKELSEKEQNMFEKIDLEEKRLTDELDVEDPKYFDKISEILKQSKETDAHKEWEKLEGELFSYREWLANDEEYIKEYDKLKEECHKNKKIECFRDTEYNKPGVLIEIDDGFSQQFLIGDINEQGGVCDDCMGFSSDVIVKRCKIILEK